MAGTRRRRISGASAIHPLQDPRVLLARVGVRQILDLAIGHARSPPLELAMRHARDRDREHPVERAVHEIDRLVHGAGPIARIERCEHSRDRSEVRERRSFTQPVAEREGGAVADIR